MSKEEKFHFNIFSFTIAFIIGMLYVFYNSPKPTYIIKYPTPYNINKYTYKGLDEECYKFKVEEVKCTVDSIKQPIV